MWHYHNMTYLNVCNSVVVSLIHLTFSTMYRSIFQGWGNFKKSVGILMHIADSPFCN